MSIDPNTENIELWTFRFFLAAVFSMTFSIALGETLLVLSLLSFLVYSVKKRSFPEFPFLGWIVSFVILAILTSIYGQNPAKGIFRLTRLFWFIVVPLSATLVSSRQRVVSVLKAFSLGCGVLFLDVCIKKPLEVRTRMGAGERYEDMTFLEALKNRGSMTDGEMLLLGVLASLGLFFMVRSNREKAKVWLALFGVQSIALYINFKRGSWICAGGLLAVLVGVRCGRKVLLWFLLAVNIAAWSPHAQERFAEIADQFDPRTGARWPMWTEVAPGLIKDYPLGVGYGSLSNRLMRKYYRFVEPGRSHLHNNVLQVLVETGWLGLGLYLCWMGHVLINAIRFTRNSWRWPTGEQGAGLIFLLMLLALFGTGIIEYNFGDAELLIVLCVIMGVSGSKGALCPEQQ